MNRLLFCALALSMQACATTNEMAVAPNKVRLDTHASGLAFVGSASSMTMKRAAETTLARGYTHFSLEDASMSSGRQVAGINARANGFGGIYASPVMAPTANVGVTVVMFRGATPGAWSAKDVLARGGKV